MWQEAEQNSNFSWREAIDAFYRFLLAASISNAVYKPLDADLQLETLWNLDTLANSITETSNNVPAGGAACMPRESWYTIVVDGWLPLEF